MIFVGNKLYLTCFFECNEMMKQKLKEKKSVKKSVENFSENVSLFVSHCRVYSNVNAIMLS